MIAPTRALTLALFLAFCAPASAIGQQSSSDDLARRVATLERMNRELEERVRNLESRLTPAGPATPAIPTIPGQPGSGDWHTLANWRRLKRGMTYDQVRSLLGEPDRISGGGVARWSWGDNLGYATVTFISDKLESWQEPER